MAEQTICFTEQEAFAILWALWDALFAARDAHHLSAVAAYQSHVELVTSRIDEHRPRS